MTDATNASKETTDAPVFPQNGETIRVLGKRVRIHRVSDSPLQSEFIGRSDSMTGNIYVADYLSPDQTRDTVLHEILHALSYAMRLGLEENQVHALAAGLYAFTQDNPDFAADLFNLTEE